MTGKDLLLSWVTDAHAFEISSLQKLQDHLDEAADPDVADKLKDHLAKTNLHAEALAKFITKLGGKISATKQGVATAQGILASMQGDLSDDLPIRNLLADIADERAGIARYNLLIAAAEECGEQELLNACKDILREEEEMAAWLEAKLPETVQKFLQENS